MRVRPKQLAPLWFVLLGARLAAQDASVNGAVTNSLTGEVMNGVHITLFSISPEGLEKDWGAMSDKAGHFSVASIPAGSYIVLAQKAGFVYVRPKDSPVPIADVTLKPGEKLADFKITMAPEAVIRGRVVDEFGDPIMGLAVEAQPASKDTMPDVFRLNPNPMTDDRGEFHIAGAAGKFYVVVNPRNNTSRDVALYTETYYPGVGDKARAAVVDAIAGRETAGIEIRLTPQRALSISGSVTADPGAVEAGSILVFASMKDGTRTQTQSGARFRFNGLADGEWVLRAQTTGAIAFRSRPVAVRLNGADADNVALRLERPGTITGSIAIAGQKTSAGKRSVNLESEAGSMWGMGAPPAQAQTDTEANFHLERPAEGTYRVKVAPLEENEYVQSLTVDGAKVEGDELDLANVGVNPQLKITLSRDGASISGKVTGKDEQPASSMTMIYCAPDGAKPDAMQRPEMVANGTYRLAGLRPGKYRLFAFDVFSFAASFADGAEDLMQKLMDRAELVELKEGDHLNKDLKAISREDADAKSKQ